MVILAVPSDICGGTSSDPSADIVRAKVSSFSTSRSAVVETFMVLDVSPAAKEIVVLTAA